MTTLACWLCPSCYGLAPMTWLRCPGCKSDLAGGSYVCVSVEEYARRRAAAQGEHK